MPGLASCWLGDLGLQDLCLHKEGHGPPTGLLGKTGAGNIRI